MKIIKRKKFKGTAFQMMNAAIESATPLGFLPCGSNYQVAIKSVPASDAIADDMRSVGRDMRKVTGRVFTTDTFRKENNSKCTQQVSGKNAKSGQFIGNTKPRSSEEEYDRYASLYRLTKV